jgi:mRNA interferase HigB
MGIETMAHRNWIISRRKFREFIEAHPEHAGVMKALMGWRREALRAEWTSFAAVRETFGDASKVGRYVVFNIAGNKVRLVALIFYNTKPRRIFIKHILTHREYDKGDWKT